MAETPASMVRIESLLLGAEPGLVEAVRQIQRPTYLGGLGQRWYADPRPEARALLHRYLEAGVDLPGHHVLVKRVFKLAESSGGGPGGAEPDGETMGRLMYALDRLETWVLRDRRRWDRDQGRMVRVRRWAVGASVMRRSPAKGRGVAGAEALFRRGMVQQGFTLATRRYLQRRCWRFFRRWRAAQPGRCAEALCRALCLYRDADIATPARLLGAWGFVHALYGRSPLISAERAGWRLREGAALSGLVPAPGPGFGGAAGLALLEGRSRAVRAAGVGLVRAALAGADPGGEAADPGGAVRLARALLGRCRSEDPDVLGLVAEAIGRLPAEDLREMLPEGWEELLTHPDPRIGEAALARLEAQAERWDEARLIRLARRGHARVARWALAELGRRPSEALRGRLALAEGTAIPAEAGAWLAGLLRGATEERDGIGAAEGARALLDARQPEVRAAGMRWFAEDLALQAEGGLYAAMAESPDPDVQAFLLGRLEMAGRWGDPAAGVLERGGLGDGELLRLWAAVILGVRQGGRARLAALRLAVARLAARSEGTAIPAEAARRARLLPVVEWGLRSARATERREALALLVGAMRRDPGLRALRVRGLEIDWGGEEGAGTETGAGGGR